MTNFHISKKTYQIIRTAQSSIVLIIMFIIIRSTTSWAYVPSASMYPTLAVKEAVFAINSGAKNIDYGDIVLFYPDSEDPNTIYIKRLIGKPGDHIEVTSDGVIRNGEMLNESYLMEDHINETMDEIVIPDGCYFFMGDNRNNSSDSRVFGAIPAENVIGKVTFHFRLFKDPELEQFQAFLTAKEAQQSE